MEPEYATTRVDWSRWGPPALVAVGLMALVALALAWEALHHSGRTRAALGTELRTMKQAYERDRELLRQRLAQSEETNAQLQGELSIIMKRLRLTQNELKHAHAEADQIREHDNQHLAEMSRAVETELAAKASAEDLKTLGGDVSGVKNDLEATKQSLQLARGELGTLIARNHNEIDALRRLGERDYYEFTIDRKGSRQLVGNVQIELRGTNIKKNLFSVMVYLNDRRVEKRDQPIDQPFYFYERGALTASEIVVNSIDKNKITGYLSVPKPNARWAGR